jgi:hypothetical protein
MDDIDPDKREAALLARLEAEREQRLAEKIANGEIVSVPLYVVAGSQTELRSKVEEAKASAIADLRATGDQREVVFTGTVVVTGVLRPGEAADPASVPTAPTFSSREDALPSPVPSPVSAAPAIAVPPDEVVEEGAVREEPQPPLIETYICVQTRQCHDDDDPGEIAEGWFSVDAGQVTVTNKAGKCVGSRALKGEDARVVAKQLLREKSPEAESFNRRLSYPNAGLA